MNTDDDAGGADDVALLTVELETGAATRSAEGWAGWEQQRTRTFLSAAEQPIDDQGKLGRIRNIALALEIKRDGEGFVGSWTFTIEAKIGPNRVQRDGRANLELRAGSAVVISVPASGLATACGDWRSQSWSGALTIEQFDAISAFGMTGQVNVRRC